MLLGVQCLRREPMGAASCAAVCASGVRDGCGGRLWSTGGYGAGRRTAVSPRGVLPAAVWGMAGCDVAGLLFHWFSQVRSVRAETSSGARASCSLGIPYDLPSISCSQADFTLPAALFLLAYLSCC